MYESFIQDRQPGLNTSATGIQNLFAYIGDGSNFTVDWNTGSTTVKNPDAIVNSIRKVVRTGASSDPATDFLRLIQDGFAVYQGSPDATDPSFRFIPWRSLFDVVFVQTLQQKDWNWLGITDSSQVADLSNSEFCRISASGSGICTSVRSLKPFQTSQLLSGYSYSSKMSLTENISN